RVLERLAALELPWPRLTMFQVDERVAPLGDVDRNRTRASAALAVPLRRYPSIMRWMPVEDPDLEAAAIGYARALRAGAGAPPVLDAVHLGLGADGHTASLFPGSPLLTDTARDVAVSEPQLGRRRMTLTLAALNRARRILWIVTGDDKRAALAGLVAGDAAVV